MEELLLVSDNEDLQNFLAKESDSLEAEVSAVNIVGASGYVLITA